MAAHRLRQLVVLSLPNAATGFNGGEVMRFVKNDQVPFRRLKKPPHAVGPLQGVDAGNQAIMLCESV